MKTLAEMNANPHRYTWCGHEVEVTYHVGGMGRSFSASHSGAKFHLIRREHIVGTSKVLAVNAVCNGAGSQTGRIARGYDTDAINCKHCLGPS